MIKRLTMPYTADPPQVLRFLSSVESQIQSQT